MHHKPSHFHTFVTVGKDIFNKKSDRPLCIYIHENVIKKVLK